MAAEDGHVSIQTQFIRDRVSEVLQTCLQTDSVHGIVSEPEFSDINVTFTTGRCPILNRTFPVLISILHGKTAEHYERHFIALFKSLPYVTYSDFESKFPGMTCDLAESLRVGFEQAIQTHYQPKQEVLLERFYRHCKVHYKRNITRMWKKLPKACRDRFRSKARRLTRRRLSGDEFQALKDSLMKEYPSARHSIKWHTHKIRGKFIYPAMAAVDNSHIGKDTNAQEGLGNDYKKLAPKAVMSIPEAIAHTVRYMERFQKDFEWRGDGGKDRYGWPKETMPKQNQPYVNGGVPPESSDSSSDEAVKEKRRNKKSQVTAKVTYTRKKKGAGRPSGGKDRVPHLIRKQRICCDIEDASLGLDLRKDISGIACPNLSSPFQYVVGEAPPSLRCDPVDMGGTS